MQLIQWVVASGLLLTRLPAALAEPATQSDTRANEPPEKPAAPAPPTGPTASAATASRTSQANALNEAALRNLQALFAGTLPTGVGLETNFAVSLDDPAAIEGRWQDLGEEVSGLEQRRAALRLRLAGLDDEMPLPAPPPLATGEAPRLPAGLEPADLQGPTAARRHRRLSAALRSALAAYQTQLAQRAAALASHTEALAAAKAERDERRDALTLELEEVATRLDLASERRRYLDAWRALARGLAVPARTALADLARPRLAVRAQAELFTKTATAGRALTERLGRLQAVATAGGLLGFRSQQEAVVQDLAALRQALDERSEKVEQRVAELAELAESIESEGKRLRQSLLRSVVEPKGASTRDELFLRYLRERRQLRRTIPRAPTSDPKARAMELTARLDDLVPATATVGSVGEAEGVVAQTTAAAEELQRISDLGLASAAQWRLAFVREVVTVFEGTVSDGARAEAHGVSTEMLQDLRADVQQVGEGVVGWAQGRRAALAALRGQGSGAFAWMRLLQLALGIGTTAIWLLARRSNPALVRWAVRRVTRLNAAHGRIGTIVRWSGLAHALVPTLVGGACAYLALWLIGFDLPEVRVAEIIYRWMWLYVLGRQALVGLTRRLSPARPAVIDMSTESVAKLSLTYRRAGLVVAFGALVMELSEVFLGSGLLQMLVRWGVWLWVAIWATWAASFWRESLARSWLNVCGEAGVERRVSIWMRRSPRAALLAPVAVARLLGGLLWAGFARLLSQQGIAAYMKARALHRLSSKAASEVTGEEHGELLPRYLREFPLYPVLGETDVVVLSRTEQYQALDEQLGRWRQQRTDSSVVVIGEKGVGKTTLLDMFSRRCGDLDVHRITLAHRATSGKALSLALSRELEVGEVEDVNELAERLRARPPRVVLVDDAHNSFMRVIDGYGGFDALVHLANATSESVFWVLVFNSYAWDFLNASRGRVHYFRRLFWIPKWTLAEIQELISRRNQRAGFQIVFDEQLLDDERVEGAALRLIEGADGYFRLLWEASGGNARLATHLWLQSLTARGANTVHVGLFRQPSAEALTNAGDDVLFSLAAICQHENLTEQELQQVLNVGPGFAHFALRYLTEYGFIEPKDGSPERMTLSPRRYMQVVRALKAKHLVYVEG